MDRLRLSQAVFAKLLRHHIFKKEEKESYSYVLSNSFYDYQGNLVVNVADEDDVLPLSDECFTSRGFANIELPKEIKAGAIGKAQKKGGKLIVLINVHDHFFCETAEFSSVDDKDDRVLAQESIKLNEHYSVEGREFVHVSLLISQAEVKARRGVPSFMGRTHFKDMYVDVVGIDLLRFGLIRMASPEYNSRQKEVFGERMIQTIPTLKVVIVGCGGTGSILAEGLARMGFKNFYLIDEDKIEESNLNRLQGATQRDIGKYKASFLTIRLRSLFKDILSSSLVKSCYDSTAIDAMKSCDIVFTCTDNPESRWFINQFVVQYMIPWFDCGTLIRVNEAIENLYRVNVVIPGRTPCGNCSPIEFIPKNMPEAFMDKTTLDAKRNAGYVEDSDKNTVSASTYSNNMLAVATLMAELTKWLGGYNFAHSIFCSDKFNRLERVDSSTHVLKPKEDCPHCSFLLGKSDLIKLPKPGNAELTDLVEK